MTYIEITDYVNYQSTNFTQINNEQTMSMQSDSASLYLLTKKITIANNFILRAYNFGNNVSKIAFSITNITTPTLKMHVNGSYIALYWNQSCKILNKTTFA